MEETQEDSSQRWEAVLHDGVDLNTLVWNRNDVLGGPTFTAKENYSLGYKKPSS